MKAVILAFALLFVGAAFAGADLDLTSADFESTISGNDYVLVMFYAPWCGHCKSLKPKFTEAAEKVGDKFVLAKVDCTDDDAKALCTEYEVRGYPTVKFFKKGAVSDYNGPRSTDGIISWLEKRTGPVSTVLDNEEAAKEFRSGINNAVIGYFSDRESATYKAFIAAAEDALVEEFKFGEVVGSDLAKPDGTVAYFRGPERGVVELNGEDEAAGVARWIFEQSFPLVGEVSAENFAKYQKLGKPLYLAFILPDDDKHAEYVAGLEKVAAENSEEAFTYINAKQYNAQIKGMGASGDVVPCIIRLSSFDGSNKPVVFERADFTAEEIKEWVDGVHSGKYAYVPKSEPIPENNDGPVTTLVGKNWDDIVMDDTKDVLVKFYAPWCGHCKKLAPEWEKLGEAFAKIPNIVIAKVDATANDVEAGAPVTGYPTLLFYKAGEKASPATYSGGRTYDALLEYVKDNAVVEFDAADIVAQE